MLIRNLSDFDIDVRNAPIEPFNRLVVDDDHYILVDRTLDFFASDFTLDIAELHARLGCDLGIILSDVEPASRPKLHIIVRINRPGSTDFNPVHEDIHEPVDHFGGVVRMVNV